MSEGWKVVSEEPAKPESSGWSVAYESPSASAVTPENAAGLSFKTLFKDPGATLSMLGDRFTRGGEDQLKHSSSGGLLGGLLGDALTFSGGSDVYGKTGAQRVQENRAAEKAQRPEAPKTALEFLTDLGSGIVYGMAAPESYATLPAKFALPVAKAGWSVAHPLVAKGVARAAEGAITNAAIDPILQGGNILREQQDGYSPVQTVIAGATGGVLSPALGLAGDVIGIQAARSEAARAAKEAERYAAAQAKTWSVEDLWGGLERQEGARGRMDVTSPKGAKGPGQLMPDTAQYVANKLGRPELAAAAMSDDPKLAWANRLLGQTYLKEQLDAFDGDPVLALAAYNAGPGAVRKWVSKFGLPDEMGRAKWIEMIPFGETRNYVKKILGDSAGAPVRLSEPERTAADAYRDEFAREMAAEREQAAQQGPDPFAQPKAPEPVQQPAQPVAEVPNPIQQAQQEMTARSEEIAQELGQPTEAKRNLWQLSEEDLGRMRAEVGASDDEKLVLALGEEGAAEFKRLDRMQNSSDPARADEGARLFDERFGNLTPDQQRLVYGIGEENAPTVEDIDELLRAHGDVQAGDGNDWLGYMGAVAARRTSPQQMAAVLRGEGSAQAQADFIRMQRAYQALVEQGVAPNQIHDEMASALVNVAGWRPEQAVEIIGAFARELNAMRGDAPRRPTSDAGALSAPENRQIAGPQDWNDPEDFGAEFDQLSKRESTTEAPAQKDLTDEALDIMRSGKAVQVGQGESLIGALVREGGIRDEGGEITNILGGAGDAQLLKRLRRVNTGMPLDDATLWAWQRGYIGKPDGDRPHIQELLDAIGDEAAGKKRYAKHNEEARLVQERIESLDEMLGYLGMDPRTHSNAEIRAAMDDFMDSASRFDDEPEYRYDEELEPGSFGMAPDRMGLGGKGEKSPMAKAREAGFRIRDMDDIMGASKGAGPKYRDQPRMQAIPANGDVSGPRLKGTRDIAKFLLNKLGIVRRQGRVRMRNADGVYSKSTGVIRTKGIHELDVVAHEIGHALEFTKQYPTLLATMKAYEKSLRGDDYDPDKKRRYEGFAEFFRRYMTNPQAAERVHPQFFHAFERAMAKDAPDDLRVMKQAQADYRAFMTAPSLDAMRTKMTNPQKMGIIDTIRKGVDEGPMEAVGDFMHEVYRGVFNSIHPWSRVVDKVQEAIERRDGVKLDLKAVDDPSKLLAAMPYVAMSGHTDLFGPRDYDDPTQITGASLIDALTLALGGKGIFGTDMLKGWNWKKEDIEDFGLYLTGRRVLHLYDRFRDGKMDRPPDDTGIGDRSPAWEQTVADLELRNPQYREAADMVYDWTDAMLKKRVKAGFISPEDYMQLQIDHPDYVPLFRDMDGFGGSGGSTLAEAGKMKQLTGSDRNYINPIHSLVQMAYQQAAMVQQNDAVAALHRIVQQAPPELGWMAEPIPAKDITSVRVGVNEVLEKAEKLVGVTEADAAIIRNVLESMFHDDDAVNVFRARDTVARRGENLIPYWKDGEMVMLQLPEGPWGKHMIEALAGMSQEGRSLAMRLISIPKQIVTATVTTIPHFFATNTVRDQIAAGLMTPSYVPGLDMARGMKSELSQDEMAHLYSAMAGEVAGMTVAGERKARAERDMRALNPAFKRVKHFASLAAIARAVSVSETGTRQGIFQRHYNEYLKQGFTPKEAATEARFQAHDYMPFSRRGAWPFMRFLTSVIPFANVALQGVDKGSRVLAPGLKNAMDWITQRKVPQTRQEIEAAKLSWKLWSGAMIFGVVGLGLEAFNSDDPWVEELGEYYKNSHWVIQKPGSDEVILFPKEQYVGAFSNAFEALFNAVKKQDPKAGERFVRSMLQVWAPPTDSPVWNLPLELAAGRDSFGTPIVPEGKKAGLKSEQKRDDTKGLAVEFTDFLREKTKRKDGTSVIDWSPAMVDHVGKGLGTSWWRELPIEKGQAPIEGVGSETTMARRFVKAPWKGAQSTKEFFDLAGEGGKWSDLAASANTMLLAGRKDEVAKLLEAASPERRAYAMASIFETGIAKQIHPMIRAEESVKVYRDLVKDLRTGDVLAVHKDGTATPIHLTPHQRRVAVDELSKLAVAEQRNALIMSNVKGWTGTKSAIPTEPIRRKIAKIAPELKEAMAYRARGVVPEATGFMAWQGNRGAYEGPLDRAQFEENVRNKVQRGSGAAERFYNQVVPVPPEPASR